MTTPEPDDAPDPRENEERALGPLYFNALMMLVLYAVAIYSSSGHSNTILAYFFLLVGLLLVNIVLAIVTSVAGKSQVAKAFLLSVLIIFLIGLGTCAYLL